MRLGEDRGYVLAPPRPHVPVACSCAFVFWPSCAVAFLEARIVDPDVCLRYAVIAICLGAIMALLLVHFRKKMAALVVCSILFGIALGLSQAVMLQTQWESIGEEDGHSHAGRAVSDGESSTYGKRVTVRLSETGGAKGLVVVSYASDADVLRGDWVHWTGDLERVDWLEDSYSWQEGHVAASNARVIDASPPSGLIGVLRLVRNRAIGALQGPDDEHALLQALACGYRGPFKSTDVYAGYQSCGVAHMVAVSGAHLVIVTGLFAAGFKLVRMPRKLSVAALISIMLAYLVLSGLPVSAIRATVMSSIGILALFGRRRPSSLNALGIGVFAILCSDPLTAASASFALSALSTFGIVMFAPLFDHWTRALWGPAGSSFLEPFALTCAASLPTQLYSCSLFQLLPIASPLCNVVLAPLFPLACGASLFAGLLSAARLPCADAVLGIALLSARFMNGIVGAISEVPYAAVPFTIDTMAAIIVSALVCGCTWLAWDKYVKARVAVAGAVLMFYFAASSPAVLGDAIVMLDVGQGDSFIVASQGETLLIDTGNQDKKLLGQIAHLRIAHIDNVLITHGDDDHCGSLDAIEQTVDVDRVLLASDALTCASESCEALVAQSRRAADEVVGLDYGDYFRVGSFTMKVIWPHRFVDDGGNADSVCLLAEYDGDGDGRTDFTALFTGDAESEQVGELIENGDVGKIDLLKVGHHGSKNATTKEEMETLNPAIAFIGVGKGNRYGHPSGETLSVLEGVGAEVFRSDRDGEVACRLSTDAVRIERIR